MSYHGLMFRTEASGSFQLDASVGLLLPYCEEDTSLSGPSSGGPRTGLECTEEGMLGALLRALPARVLRRIAALLKRSRWLVCSKVLFSADSSSASSFFAPTGCIAPAAAPVTCPVWLLPLPAGILDLSAKGSSGV